MIGTTGGSDKQIIDVESKYTTYLYNTTLLYTFLTMSLWYLSPTSKEGSFAKVEKNVGNCKTVLPNTHCPNFSDDQNDLFFLILSTDVDSVLPNDFCFTSFLTSVLTASLFATLCPSCTVNLLLLLLLLPRLSSFKSKLTSLFAN